MLVDSLSGAKRVYICKMWWFAGGGEEEGEGGSVALMTNPGISGEEGREAGR